MKLKLLSTYEEKQQTANQRSLDSSHFLLIIGTIYFILCLLPAIILVTYLSQDTKSISIVFHHLSGRKMKKDETKRLSYKSQQRRMSFTSSAIAMGCLPEHANLREPIIHALISFSSSDLPTKDQVCKELVPKFLKIYRMRGIPVCVDKKWSFDPCKNINNDDMVRVVDVDCDDIQDLGQEAQNLVEYEVRSPDRNLPWWEFVLLRNHSGVLDESMLVLRVDHAIGDGLTIGKLCTSILKFEDGSTVEDLIPEKMRLSKEDSELRAEGKSVRSWFRMLGITISALLKVVLLPVTRYDHSIAFAKGVVGKNAKDTRRRKLIIFDQVPLNFVRDIKAKADISFNDVLVVALSQAIHDFCHYNDCPVIKKHGAKTCCRATMTYGFPSNHDDLDDLLHNRW